MLRRLPRDAVGEITDVRDRLRDLERSVATERASRVADRVRVNTRVDFTVTSATPRDDPPGSARGALRATTVVEAPFPNGDSLVARCVADDGTLLVDRTASTRTSSLSSPAVVLDKLVYRSRVGRDAWIRLAVRGGEGQDVAATLNPLSKGASISGLGSSGSSVLARCRGTAACASREFADGLVGLAAGVFLGDRASDPAATPRAMAQATFRPGTRAAAAISASAAAPPPSTKTIPSEHPTVDALTPRSARRRSPPWVNARSSPRGHRAMVEIGVWLRPRRPRTDRPDGALYAARARLFRRRRFFASAGMTGPIRAPSRPGWWRGAIRIRVGGTRRRCVRCSGSSPRERAAGCQSASGFLLASYYER